MNLIFWTKKLRDLFFKRPEFIEQFNNYVSNKYKSKVIRYNARSEGYEDIRNVFIYKNNGTKISKEEKNEMKEYFTNRLISLNLLDKEIDDQVIGISKWLNKKFKYRTDISNYGRNEYWSSPWDMYEQLRNKGYILDDCLTGDTKIISKRNGIYEIKRIDELKDYKGKVLSYNFKTQQYEFKKILNWVYKGKKEVYKNRFLGGAEIKSTKDHKFFRLYRSHKKGLYFKVNKLSDFINNKRGFKSVACVNKIPSLNNNTNNIILGDKENTFILDNEDMFIIGQYISEGWSTNKRVFISGDNKEIREKLIFCLKKKNIKFSESKRKKHSYVEIFDKEYRLFLKLFGNNSFSKDIPSFILSLPRKLLTELYISFILGDGFVDKTEKNRIYGWCTVSANLNEKLMLISAILGEIPCNYLQKEHQGWGNSPIWRAEYCLNSSRHKDVLNGISKTSLLHSTKIGKEKVYDIEIEDNHNFVLSNGIISHNCDGYSCMMVYVWGLIGVPVGRRFVRAGDVYDKNGKYAGGHATACYWNERYNEVFPIEGSYYANDVNAEYEKKPLKENELYGDVWFYTNEENSYRGNKFWGGI